MHIYENYTYNKNSPNSTGTYYICTKKDCMARAKATDVGLQITKVHNHLADPVDVEELLFIAGCKWKAKESASDLCRIFDKQSSR